MLSIIFSLFAGLCNGHSGPELEHRSFQTAEEAQEVRIQDQGLQAGLGDVPKPYKPYTLMYKRGKVKANIGQLIYNQQTSYYTPHGKSFSYYNASSLLFSQEILNTHKIIFSSFVDENVFFLVTQASPSAPLMISSYFYLKYQKTVQSRDKEFPIPCNKGASLSIYKIARFGDSKIFYISGRETMKDKNGKIVKDSWVFFEYHGFSHKILQNYTIDVTPEDSDFNTAEAMPSNIYRNYTYIYLVQGLQTPYLDKNITTVNLRVTVINRSDPTKIFVTKLFTLDYQEQVSMEGYLVAGIGYFFPPKFSATAGPYTYVQQYAAILFKRLKDVENHIVMRLNKISIDFDPKLNRLQVGLVNTPVAYPSDLGSCIPKLISQVGRGQIVALCREDTDKEGNITIKSLNYRGMSYGSSPVSYSPVPTLKMAEDAVVENFAFVTINAQGVSPGDQVSPMMLLKFTSKSKNTTRVITAPFKGGFQYLKKNTLWEFDGYTDFLLNTEDHHYFVIKDAGGKRNLSLGNLGNMHVEIDLEKYTEDDYLKASFLDYQGKFINTTTKFKLNLTDKLDEFYNSGLNNGGPVTNQLYKFEKRIFLIDREDSGPENRYFVITGNLKAPQRVLPDNSSNRLDIQFYTQSTIKNITIGVEVEKFYLDNTISVLRKTFFRPQPASTKPSRRKTLEVFTNCSLTMESNFETMWCYNHFFQGYPKTENPNDAYLGAVGFSRSFLSGTAGEIMELVGDRVVNLVILQAKSNRKGRRTFGIQVPAWDKTKRNSTFISDYGPPSSGGFYSPFYLTCNLTTPEMTRNCTHYEIRSYIKFDPVTKTKSFVYYLALLEKFDLNKIPEFANHHILRIGAAGGIANIFYITREFGAPRSKIKILMRYNYTKKINTANLMTARLYTKVDRFELPLNLTDDMNFDICMGSARLVMFVSPSAETTKENMFPPKVYIYTQMKGFLVSPFYGGYSRMYWKELYMDGFNFTTIRRLQCFDDYFAVIGDDKKTPGNTRLTVFSYEIIKNRFSFRQSGQTGDAALGNLIDPLNLRRYDQSLPKAEPGLEYQIKFIRLTQRNQFVFERATFLILKSTYKPWYKDEDLLKGNPPDTSAESSLSKNYTEEIQLEAKALYHQSIYFLKGFIFENNQPTNINQTVVSSFGPPDLGFQNKARFSYINLIDKAQIFKSKLFDLGNKIQVKNQNYNLSDLVQADGTIVSLEVYYSGGEVYNITTSPKWPLLTDKLFKSRKGVPNRNRLLRSSSSVIDFSSSYLNQTAPNNKNSSSSSTKIKLFTSNIYLNKNPKPVDTIVSTEEWENVDIYTGSFKSSLVAKKLTVAVFQSQYFNTTNQRYQTKLIAKVYSGFDSKTYISMDAYESDFSIQTVRKLYMRQEDSTLIPWMFIYGAEKGGISQFFYAYKGQPNFTGFSFHTPGYMRRAVFLKQKRTYMIKGPNRLYFLGRAPDRGHFPCIQKAEFNFQTVSWEMPSSKIQNKMPLLLLDVNKRIKAMMCAQQTETEDTAVCLLYAGDGSNFVIVYNPGDIEQTPQGKIDGLMQIYIPPSNERQFEDIYEAFDFNNNLIIKSIRNRSREYEVVYSQKGKKLDQPGVFIYGGFLVWDLSRRSQRPVIQKYLSYRFSGFTLLGDHVWTSSPMDGESAIFNLSLSTSLTNQVLEIPDVEYLRTHFGDTFLKAKFLNGTVRKVPFGDIFTLPPNNSFFYAYLALGIIILVIFIVCVGTKVRKRRQVLANEIKVTIRKKTENQKKVRQFIMEAQNNNNNSTLDQSKFKSTLRGNTTLLTETSQDIML